MKVALMSDTHGRHGRLTLPPRVDAIIHAGDFTRGGGREETVTFLDWLASFDATRILIGGNHDFFAEQEAEEMKRLTSARGITWLLDEETRCADLRVYGSPWVPRFRNMAWNRARGEALRETWTRIPEGLDVLVTHGPPHGILDRIFLGAHVGCEDLRAAVLERAPPLHVFGHIHEAFGEASVPGCRTRFLNVATSRLVLGVREPVVLEL